MMSDTFDNGEPVDPYVRLARCKARIEELEAQLKAQTEPTEAMIEAAFDKWDCSPDDAWDEDKATARVIFAAGYRAAVQAAAPGSQWVSVEDRLPRQLEDCLVAVCPPSQMSQVNMAYLKRIGDEGHWVVTDEKGNHADFITHWMPLPSPPEVDSDDV